MSTVDPLSIGRIMSSDLSQPQRSEMASGEFETYFVEMLLKEMRKSVPKGMFSSPAMDLFTEMMDKAIAREIAESGGLGFAAAMLDQSDEAGSLAKTIQVARDSMPVLREIQERSIPQGLNDISSHQPLHGKLTSAFGMREHPILGVVRMHNGIDIAAAQGTEVEAALPGTVVFSGKRGGYGNTIMIEHSNGLTTMYAHCASLSVQKGDVVRQGESIATVGSTGLSTGPHLHFEVRREGAAIDPQKVFPWSFEE